MHLADAQSPRQLLQKGGFPITGVAEQDDQGHGSRLNLVQQRLIPVFG
jgi:hypothetical protein